MRFLKWLLKNSRWILNEIGAFAVTTDFTANTTISSSQMNTNFGDVETAINSIHSYIGNAVITNAMLAGSIDLTSKVTGLLPAANFVESGDVLLSTIAKTQSGWTEITSTYSGRYLRLGGTGLATGGASTHTHAAGSYAGPSHTHNYSGTTSTASGSWTGDWIVGTVATAAHSHTFSGTSGAGGTGAITGTSASGNNTPLYVDLRAYQKS